MVILVKVVEKGSFSAATRELGTTASAVSRQIARLEQALGLRLLERSTRRLRLNEAGHEVYLGCQRILSSASDVLEISDSAMSAPQGQVRLSAYGGSPRAFRHYLPAALYRRRRAGGGDAGAGIAPMALRWPLSRYGLGAVSPQSPVAAQNAGIYRFSGGGLVR